LGRQTKDANTHANIVEKDVDKAIRGLCKILIKLRPFVVETDISAEAFDPVTFLIRSSNSNDLAGTDNLDRIAFS
jgi:hypothetical protein